MSGRERNARSGGKEEATKQSVEKLCLVGQKLGETSVRERENRKMHPFLGIFMHISKTNPLDETQRTQELSERSCIWRYVVIKPT